MKKKEIKIEAPFAAAGVTLVAVAETSLNYWQGKNGSSFFGTRQPVCLVVISPQARQAFHISGEEITLKQLTEEVPGIEEILKRI